MSLAALPTPDSGRASVNVHDRQLREITTDLIDELRAHNDPPELYVRSGYIVRVKEDEHGRPSVETVTESVLRHRISQTTDIVKRTSRGVTSISPPIDAVRDVLARGWWPFPPLEAITEIPTLRPDGTIHAEAGYDPATRILHVPARGLVVPPVPEHPHEGQVVDAVELLEELTCDFPFDSDADRANAYGALLTTIVRPAIGGQIPLALFDAPEPGTGKGLYTKVMAIVITGRTAAMKPLAKQEEEIRKMITSTLLAGPTIVVLDNVDDAIRSPSLALLLTSDVWDDRVLGRSENVQLPNRATWIATGNNLQVAGDIARRCYQIRLDAKRAKPYLRTGFRHDDLEGWTHAHRGELLHALLVLARAWWAAGKPTPQTVPTLGGFTPWARTIAGILAHAGVDGFLDNQIAFIEGSDSEAQEWEAFLTGWYDSYGQRQVTTADIALEVDTPGQSRLRALLPGDLNDHAGKPSFTRKLGNLLKKQVGRHRGDPGWHIVKHATERSGKVLWSVDARSLPSHDPAGTLPFAVGNGQSAESTKTAENATGPVAQGPHDERGVCRVENISTPERIGEPYGDGGEPDSADPADSAPPEISYDPDESF